MVTASLRKNATATKIAVDTTIASTPIPVAGVKDSINTVAKPSMNIEDLVVAEEVIEPGINHTPVADGEAPVPRQGNQASQNRSAAFDAVDGIDGDWNDDDIKFPVLKQVQGSGPLSKMFDAGTIIYGEEILLSAPSVRPDAKNTPIVFTPISITKQFREKLNQEAQDAGERPRIFQSIQEVEEAGLTTRWIGNTMPDNYAEASARCLFLLRLPAGSDHPGFVLDLDGQSYAVAVYYAAGGAFRSSAKIIANTALTSLLVPVMGEDGQPKKNPNGSIQKRPLLFKCFWNLNFAKVTAGNYEVWRPVVKLQRDETGPQVREYINRLMHSEQAGEAQQD